MAFPVIQSSAEFANGASSATTTHTVTMPSGLASGDFLLIIWDKGSVAYTVNALTGYTELLDENLANGIFIAYRVADGTEGASVNFTSSVGGRSAGAAYRITGALDPATQAPQLSTVATGTSVNPNATTCTPTGGAKDYLWITFFGMAGEQADDDTLVTTTPTNYGNTIEKTCAVAGTNLGGMFGSADRQANAASEDAGAWTTIDNAAWRAYTLAVHPAPPTTSPTDDVGVTDAQDLHQQKVFVDNVGITDAATVTTGGDSEVANPVDPVGITDFIDLLVGRITDLPPDAIGITDTADVVLPPTDDTVNPVDNVGLTDDADIVRDVPIDGDADPIGISDSATLVKSLTVSVSDPVGVTDAAALNQAKTFTDPVGVTDSAALDQAKTFADPVDITDSAALNQGKTFTDNIGVTDAAALAADRPMAVTDNVGITDAAAFAADRPFAVTDNIGITDNAAVEKQGAGAVSPVDGVGISDAAVLDVSRVIAPTDNIGITDTHVEDEGEFVTDNVGITDSATLDKQGAGAVAPSDNVGISDTALIVVTRVIGPTDVVGIADNAAMARQIAKSVADAVGITDSVQLQVGDIIDDPLTITGIAGPVIPTITVSGPGKIDSADVTGPATMRGYDGPVLVSVGVSGPEKNLVPSMTGPNINEIMTDGPDNTTVVIDGPETARVITGPGV